MSNRQQQQRRHAGERGDKRKTSGQRGQDSQLSDSPMMRHLLDGLEAGTDIGHYGRLTFVMVARFFMREDELVGLLERQPDVSHEDALALVTEVAERDYSPPQRDTILRWQQRQDFPICLEVDDPRGCDVYRDLQFPEQVYNHIQQFYLDQAEAEGAEGEESVRQP
ncbi:MAG TPA: hypothetical protein VFU88_08290 [Ktedonobacterales bacterium]|nr:hypothetical protein [Ktedonobacterales bacterium]